VPGTKAGGLKSAQKIRERDPDFFKRIGQQGSKNGAGLNYTGGFAHPTARPDIAGMKGGKKSRRGKPQDRDAMLADTYYRAESAKA